MNIIAVINTGDYWLPNARYSVEAAAERWGCTLHEVTRVANPLRSKFRLNLDAERVLLLDADILIREDCPDPFELVAPNRLGCVSGYQDDDRLDERIDLDRRAWGSVCQWLGHKDFHPSRMLNGGFLLWTTDFHGGTLANLDSLLPEALSPLEEQAAWAWAFGDEACFLPPTFNRVGRAVWTSPPFMHSHVYHWAAYFGWKGEMKRERIERTTWLVPSEYSDTLGILSNQSQAGV